LKATGLHMLIKTYLAIILLMAFGGGLSPASGLAGGSEKIPVIASILPLADFCRQVGGERVDVQVLIPPGASPHVFEPPPSVMTKAFQARVFVYVGAGLEPWASKILHSREPGKVAVVEAAQGIPLIGEIGEHAAEQSQEKEHLGHRHEAGNPHIWLDPVLAQDICRRIAAALIRVDPGHRFFYEARLGDYLTELAALDRDIMEQVKTWRIRGFISFHPAFSYFARRYGLKEMGVMELAPGREPTPRHLQEIVAAIRNYGFRVVFAEPQLNPRVAQVVAREAGVKVLMLDPLGGRPLYGDDYLKLMRYNLATMEEAMK